MKIAYVSAGAGGMLCGSCMHDNALAAAIGRAGHDIVLIPTYTPIRTDERDVSLGQVFYGAVNVYLQGLSGFFRHTPRALDRLLDNPSLLRWVSRQAATTSAADLGGLTLSVLKGEEGDQAKELRRLVAWLKDEFKPEIVHLTNSMFLGMAASLKRELRVPVVCSVQGEDLFLDGLPEPHRANVRNELRRHAGDADAFIATTHEYAGRMSEMLALPADRMHVVPLGVNLSGLLEEAPPPAARPYTVGYLARVCPEKGFHLLAEAFRLLADRVGRERVRLRAAGYLGPGDKPWFEEVRARIQSWGLGDMFEYLGEVDRPGKVAFFRSIDVMSVPTIYKEAKGLSVLESLACGVAVVQPAHGSFPEMLERTGGGLLFEPGSASELAGALRSLMDDPARRAALGAAGRRAVAERCSDDVMARDTLKVYLAASGGVCTS